MRIAADVWASDEAYDPALLLGLRWELRLSAAILKVFAITFVVPFSRCM